ncbi:hypothetical protein [Halocatena salina]|uniref:Uncharacterized protein n=1 Tax=Halocatena salina TaxID=2934340 RepID=A0A8U0A988_9EURY|nr:hypothetical protein [Halocatena salina]UPM44427.1 hypothetical protein MW046_13345 [Halocatena salina]
MTTAVDIVHNEPIDIRLKYRRSTTPSSSSIECFAYFQDVRGVFVTLTIFPNNDYLIEHEWEDGHWYQFEGMNGNIYDGEIGIKHRDGASVAGAAPPDQGSPSDGHRAADEYRPNLHVDTARIAVDIEVLTTVPESVLDLDDSEHIELFCLGVGYQPDPSYPPITDVLFRPADGPAGECQLLEQFCRWLDDHPGQTLFTYCGKQFDLPHLQERARIATETVTASGTHPSYEGLEDRITETLASYTHVDLAETAFKAFDYPSLDDLLNRFNIDVPQTYWAAYNHGFDVQEWRTEQQEHTSRAEPTVMGSDIPQFADHWLTLHDHGATETCRFRSLDALLRKYVETDITPLFELSHIQPFFGNYQNEIKRAESD